VRLILSGSARRYLLETRKRLALPIERSAAIAAEVRIKTFAHPFCSNVRPMQSGYVDDENGVEREVPRP